MKAHSKILFVLLILILPACYHPHAITQLPKAESVTPRTLFIALDGVPYDLMKELKDEGYFKTFNQPKPFISTFPSATTIGFTGIFQPLNVGQVPGYETRFYSIKENKIIGGTPFDIYKIPVNYKYYFDSFRHRMEEKAAMYAFPGMAGKQDLIDTEEVLMESNKNVVMTYLGGTDGTAHLLGRNRSKRFLAFMDRYLERMQRRYQKKKGEPLRIIIYSDHGFRFGRLKTVSQGEIRNELKKRGLNLNDKIKSEKDVVAVTYGLLTAGVLFTDGANRQGTAEALSQVRGIDLAFWHDDTKRSVHILNNKGERARFDYRGLKSYRYVPVKGDPLRYGELLKHVGFTPGQWLDEQTWFRISYDHYYPDAGYRLYDSFFNLVENKAGVMFSTVEDYQFGSLAAKMGTMIKSHKGTHGGLFRSTSQGVLMTNEKMKPEPKAMRYDDLFHFYLSPVVRAYESQRKMRGVTGTSMAEDHHH